MRNLNTGSQSVFNVCDRGFTINKAKPGFREKIWKKKTKKDNNQIKTKGHLFQLLEKREKLMGAGRTREVWFSETPKSEIYGL